MEMPERAPRFPRPAFLALVLCCGAALLLVGCRTNFEKMRHDHAETFPSELEEKTAAILAHGSELGLDDCIRIALKNNLSLKSAEIQRRLAGLDKNIAFSAFLPQIQVEYSWHRTDNLQMIKAGGHYTAMSDQRVENFTVAAQQPIFVPSAWLIYSMRQKGEDISELVLERTRQMIQLQVAYLYYAHLSRSELAAWLEDEVAQAEALLKQVSALEREGLETRANLLNVEALLQARRNGVKENRRLEKQTRAELLETMGLYPFAELTLKREAPLSIVEQTLEEDVLEALLNRPELGIADRTITVNKEQARLAIAAFLPQVMGVGAFNYTSDSHLRYSGLWSHGISAVLMSLNGFRTVFEYQAARKRGEDGFVQREQTCMAIMIEALKARLSLDAASDELALSEKALLAAAESFREAEALEREGWIDTAARIERMAARDAARARVALARFQEQVSTAAALGVLGRSR